MRTFAVELVGEDDYLTKFRMVLHEQSATVAIIKVINRYYELIEKKLGVEDTHQDSLEVLQKLDIKEI